MAIDDTFLGFWWELGSGVCAIEKAVNLNMEADAIYYGFVFNFFIIIMYLFY
jgi:hypothetical protein